MEFRIQNLEAPEVSGSAGRSDEAFVTARYSWINLAEPGASPYQRMTRLEVGSRFANDGLLISQIRNIVERIRIVNTEYRIRNTEFQTANRR